MTVAIVFYMIYSKHLMAFSFVCHGSGTLKSLLDQRSVAVFARHGMDGCPTVLAIVLETVNIATEEWSIFSTTLYPMAFIARLVIQNIRFYLHLRLLKRLISTKC